MCDLLDKVIPYLLIKATWRPRCERISDWNEEFLRFKLRSGPNFPGIAIDLMITTNNIFRRKIS